MEEEGKVMTLMTNMTYCDELPAPVEFKLDIKEESDYINYVDCKEEFSLEDKLAQFADCETKLEDDLEMPEAEISTENLGLYARHEELFLKDEEDDISLVNLAAPYDSKVPKAVPLEEESNVSKPLAGLPKEENLAGEEEAGKDAEWYFMDNRIEVVIDAGEEEKLTHTATKETNIVFKCKYCKFTTVSPLALSTHQARHSGDFSKTCQKTLITKKCSKAPFFISSKYTNNNASDVGMFKCSYYACTFKTFNQRAFIRHRHPTSFKREKKASSKVVNCRHCPVALRLNHLLSHTLRIHKDQIEKCNKCRQQIPSQLLSYHHCGKIMPEKLDPLVGTRKPSINPVKFHVKNIGSISSSTETYNCYQCSYSTNLRRVFIKHTKKHADNLPMVKCKKCDYTSLVQIVGRHFAKNHVVTLKGNPIKQCPCCDFNSVYHTLIQHINKSHRSIVNGASSFKCRECSLSTNTAANLERHHQEHVNGYIVQQCPQCDYRSTGKALVRHLQCAHNKVTGRGRFKKVNSCKLCSYKTCNVPAFRRHEKVHLKSNFIEQCPYCEYKSTDRALFCHLKRSHGQLTAKRQLTGIELDTKRYEERPFISPHEKVQCPQCDYKSTSTGLFHHLKWIHNTLLERQGHSVIHQCRSCSYVTPSFNHFKRHTKTHFSHSNHLIEQCPHCEFASTSRALKSHIIMVHTSGPDELKEEYQLSKSTVSKGTVKVSKTVPVTETGEEWTQKKYLKRIKLEENDTMHKTAPMENGALWSFVVANFKSRVVNGGKDTHRKNKKLKLLCRFKCDECQFSTVTRFALAKHQAQHSV